ncbi:MAG TPA: hypothetical protein VGM50_18290 [Gemmatimonadaceae bacterium]
MSNDFLRHTLATLAYRASKPLRDAPLSFADYRAKPDSRTPGEIVAHLGDLMNWGRHMAIGEYRWANWKAGDWSVDVARFFDELKTYDDVLASTTLAPELMQRLFQGSIADSLTHVGQLTMLRRMSGAPIRGENYSKADISIAHLGIAQPAPKAEFD